MYADAESRLERILAENPEAALAQIRAKDYAAPYRVRNLPIWAGDWPCLRLEDAAAEGRARRMSVHSGKAPGRFFGIIYLECD